MWWSPDTRFVYFRYYTHCSLTGQLSFRNSIGPLPAVLFAAEGPRSELVSNDSFITNPSVSVFKKNELYSLHSMKKRGSRNSNFKITRNAFLNSTAGKNYQHLQYLGLSACVHCQTIRLLLTYIINWNINSYKIWVYYILSSNYKNTITKLSTVSLSTPRLTIMNNGKPVKLHVYFSVPSIVHSAHNNEKRLLSLGVALGTSWRRVRRVWYSSSRDGNAIFVKYECS